MVKRDFKQFLKVMNRIRGGKPFDVLLTVSPVPLTATASGKHVLLSTVYSKSILRSVAEYFSSSNQRIDYFPSYEIVTNPRMHSTAFKENLRSVRDEAVDIVMKHFFAEHKVLEQKMSKPTLEDLPFNVAEDIQCEDALLDAFSK